jgi:branched-chain amino acid transport system permease protein
MMRHLAPLLLFAAVVGIAWLPGLPPFWLTLLDYIGLASIVALGLVVLTGVGNVTSFGQAMFVGVGAYATAILSTRYGWSPWATLPVAVLLAAALAWVVGAITLRLSGHYLPLGTLAWNIGFFYVLGNLDLFGRYDGISGIPPLAIGDFSLVSSASVLVPIWGALALLVIATLNLLDSRIGRAIRALKGGAVAARSFGIDTAGIKILAFVYAAVLAAVAGWLYAHMQRAINPTPFGLNASIEYLLMAVVGGVGSVGGAIFGAGLVTILRDQLQDVLPRLVGAQGSFETIVFGAILVLMLQFAPDGLWPALVKVFPRRERTAPPVAGPALPRRADDIVLQAGAPLLETQGLRKTFGGLVAVNEVGFAVKPAEIVGLIGPNGAGKSTTFNLVTGVARPTAGRVRFAGREIAGMLPRRVARLGVARTFQHVKLVRAMSVVDNVALGAHLRGRAGPLRAVFRLERREEAAMRAEAMRALDRVGLAEHAARPAGSLALGQQRIVEIARALCLDPRLLLLDEPAAGLRHREKAELAALLRRLRAEGLAILLVEHDMEFVMGLTDHLVVMNFGAKLAEGAPAAVRTNPAVVEAYLGAA